MKKEMASTDSSERRCTKAANQLVGSGGAPPPEPEQLKCPRCQSNNTKFCYYNNYNFSQPRHFCKSCRRYWTHGGTLRDIPVGGGSRKNAKRSRTIPSSATATGSSSSTLSFASSTPTYEHHHHTAATASQILAPLAVGHGGSLPFISAAAKSEVNLCGSFSSLLNTHGPGFFAMGGFGLGLGAGVHHEDMGFGLARALWPFPGIGVGESTAAPGLGGPSGLGNAWQLQSGGEGGIVGGDCFTLSDVAISAAGHGMK